MRMRIYTIEQLKKGGPFLGPKGGLWADPQHTVPWDNEKHGEIKPHNCPVCRGLGHVVRRQQVMGGGEHVSSGVCRTCNKHGKLAFSVPKAHALGLPIPKEHQPAQPKHEEAKKPAHPPQQLGLDFKGKPEQQSLFHRSQLEPTTLSKNLPVKERMRIHGLNVHIENPKGSVRRWYDPAKKKHGETVMVHPYGYIHGTKGADGEDVDAFVGPHPESKLVVIINQRRTKDLRRFDEHKVMLGFRSAEEAKAAYLKNYDSKGKALLGSIRVWTIERFKRWLEEGKTHEPAAKSLTVPR